MGFVLLLALSMLVCLNEAVWPRLFLLLHFSQVVSSTLKIHEPPINRWFQYVQLVSECLHLDRQTSPQIQHVQNGSHSSGLCSCSPARNAPPGAPHSSALSSVMGLSAPVSTFSERPRLHLFFPRFNCSSEDIYLSLHDEFVLVV